MRGDREREGKRERVIEGERGRERGIHTEIEIPLVAFHTIQIDLPPLNLI